jgi:hypothetical protein
LKAVKGGMPSPAEILTGNVLKNDYLKVNQQLGMLLHYWTVPPEISTISRKILMK